MQPVAHVHMVPMVVADVRHVNPEQEMDVVVMQERNVILLERLAMQTATEINNVDVAVTRHVPTEEEVVTMVSIVAIVIILLRRKVTAQKDVCRLHQEVRAVVTGGVDNVVR